MRRSRSKERRPRRAELRVEVIRSAQQINIEAWAEGFVVALLEAHGIHVPVEIAA